jgi:hypothetical protein
VVAGSESFGLMNQFSSPSPLKSSGGKREEEEGGTTTWRKTFATPLYKENANFP